MATITRTSDRDRERMRRSAMAADQGPSEERQSGGYPLTAMLQSLGDPQDPTNVSFPFLRRMRRDHMVSMGLHFIAMPIVKAPWYYECDNAQVATFADKLIRPIYGRLILTILRFLWAGYSPGAKNFQSMQPKWTYIDENGNRKPVWDNGNIDAIVYKPVTQLKPELARPVWDANGHFNGIRYDTRYGDGYFIINGQQTPDIDLLHSVWAVHDQDNEDGSPYGFPRIAHCAPIFHMYRYIWTLMGRAFENNADPGPVVRYPRDEAPAIGDDDRQVSNVRTALRLGTRRRSGSTIALPSDPYTDYTDRPGSQKKWDIEYPKSETNFEALLNFLGTLDSLKLRALWIQEQGLIEGSGGTSNRNVAQNFSEQRDESQIVLMGQIDQVIDESFIQPAIAMNMPWFEGELRKRTFGLGQGDEELIRQVFQLMGQGNAVNMATFGIDVRKLAESRGFPMLDPAAQQKLLDAAAKEAESQPTPAVTPTQGRRALVTQTGFGDETAYQQLGGRIELAADGDFVSSLPRTDVFADKSVVAVARELRGVSSSFLSWAYSDFARFLGKQRNLDLDEELGSIEREALVHEGLELDSEEKIKRLVDRLINRWRPQVEKLSGFSEGVRRVLGKAYDRTVALKLKVIGSDSSLSSTDKAAAAYLDEQGARLVRDVVETTRSQIAAVLADGIREGKTTSQLAADVRSSFEGVSATRASTIARSEISEAYNYATVQAGLAGGVKKAQLLDGKSDEPCRKRNGRIVDLADALNERLNHPNCTFTVRLLPKASAAFEIRHEPLSDGLRARFDSETETVLMSPDIDRESEVEYLLALGERLT